MESISQTSLELKNGSRLSVCTYAGGLDDLKVEQITSNVYCYDQHGVECLCLYYGIDIEDDPPLEFAIARSICRAKASIITQEVSTDSTVIAWGNLFRGNRSSETSASILIDQRYSGNGLGTKLLTSLLDTGFNYLRLPVIRSDVAIENTASIRMNYKVLESGLYQCQIDQDDETVTFFFSGN